MHGISSNGDFWYNSDGGTAFTSANNQQVRRANNALLQSSAFVGGHLRRGPHRLRLWVWGLDRQQGVPSLGIRQALQTQLRKQQVITNFAYRLIQPGSGHIEAQLYVQALRQRYQDPKAEVTPYPSASDDRSALAGARGFGTWQWAPGWQFSAVAQGRWETLTPRDALAEPPMGVTSRRWWGTTGMELDAALGKLHVIPSVLLEGALDRRAGRDAFGHFVPAAGWRAFLPQGRIGVWHDVDLDWSWRANIARYARMPGALELYGDSHGILGNSGLVPETGFNADIGARVSPGDAAMPWRAEVAAFAALSQDLITFQQNAVGLARAINLGRARILGVDASGQWQPMGWLQVALQATFMDARDASATPQGAAGVFLPNRPRWHVLLQPRVDYLGLHAAVDADYVGGTYLDPANLVALPDRLVFGASLGWRFNVGDVALRMQNLLDARVFDIAGFPLPSRSLMLTLRLQSLDTT